MGNKTYRIMEISEGTDSKIGKVWIIKANPAVKNEFSGATSIESEIYEGTETFLLPYYNEMVDEIEAIAQHGQLWSPTDNDWNKEVSLDEKVGKRVVIHRFGKNKNSNKGVVATDRKPLKQYLLEQNADIMILSDTESGKMFFECGKIHGFVSPAAAKRINDFNNSIDEFEFAMVAKEGEDAIPCIMAIKSYSNATSDLTPSAQPQPVINCDSLPKERPN